MTLSITLTGTNRRQYRFTLYPKTTSFKDIRALYCFLAPHGDTWKILYIGQTHSLGDRMQSHNKWPEVNRLGCTHIGVCYGPAVTNLDTDEKALIEAYQPCCNDQLVR